MGIIEAPPSMSSWRTPLSKPVALTGAWRQAWGESPGFNKNGKMRGSSAIERGGAHGANDRGLGRGPRKRREQLLGACTRFS
jgi:hypothetical protein